MKTISIPINNRPNHLARVLGSIREAQGSDGWVIVASCEPPINESIRNQLSRLPNCSTSWNPHRLGCWHNTFHAAALAMALSPTVNLYLEDDYLITPDALTLVDQWSSRGYPGILCLRRWHDFQSVDRPDAVSPAQHGLLGCGFAWRSDLWPLIRQAWFSADEHGYFSMWDIGAAHWLNSRDITQWRPMVNRSYGIGTTGTHSRSGNDLNLFGPAYSGHPISSFNFIP